MPEASTRPPRHVFVYGSLRRGGSNDITRLQPAPRFVGPAQLPGRLYHLGAYPGMTLGGAQWVQGEVYAIDPGLEVLLDEIEGMGADTGDEYIKRQVPVQVQGQALSCLVYEIDPRFLGSARSIAHGDWLKGD